MPSGPAPLDLPRGPASLTFVGTATTLLRLGTFTVLTDPNFLHKGQRAWLGKGLWSRRLTEPAMQPADLPPLDAVVLSHLHGDHFDRVARAELPRTQPVITTVPAATTLARWGFATEGLATWQEHRLVRPPAGDAPEETLTVQALPGVHARGAIAPLIPPTMGSLLEHRVGGEGRTRLYLSGDTLTGDHLDEIARRHPDIDVAVVHLGGTRVLFSTVTMDADQGVDFMRRIRPGTAVPVHHDDYGVFVSPLSSFLARAAAAGLSGTIRTVRRGETLDLTERGTPSRSTPA